MAAGQRGDPARIKSRVRFLLKPMPMTSLTWAPHPDWGGTFRITVASARALAEPPDLAAFADWAESADPDLVDEAHATFDAGPAGRAAV
jgi:hypothetical protein